MKWTVTHDRTLLLFCMERHPVGVEYEVLAQSFKEKPTTKAVVDRISTLHAEQDELIKNMGIYHQSGKKDGGQRTRPSLAPLESNETGATGQMAQTPDPYAERTPAGQDGTDGSVKLSMSRGNLAYATLKLYEPPPPLPKSRKRRRESVDEEDGDVAGPAFTRPNKRARIQQPASSTKKPNKAPNSMPKDTITMMFNPPVPIRTQTLRPPAPTPTRPTFKANLTPSQTPSPHPSELSREELIKAHRLMTERRDAVRAEEAARRQAEEEAARQRREDEEARILYDEEDPGNVPASREDAEAVDRLMTATDPTWRGLGRKRAGRKQGVVLRRRDDVG